MTDRSTRLASQPLADYRASQSEIDHAIQQVLARGRYILGPEVELFEKEFAGFVGTTEAIGVANGTDALVLSLRSLGVGPGDAVITVSHTAVATVAAIELTGARPVLVDIDPASCTLDPDKLAATLRGWLGPMPKAVIVVHLYGHPAAMPAIVEIARRHGLAIVEDCAQAHGARFLDRAVGTWGDVAAFSFYPTKNLGAIGDGGAVVTSDGARAARIRQLREYGWKERYISEVPGLNSRLDELQAAILRVKCRRLAADNQRRRVLAALYSQGLAGTRVTAPQAHPEATPVYHQYVVRTPNRDALRSFLASRGIPTAIHYPQAVHQQPAYRDRVAIGYGGMPETERAAQEVLSLPMHPHLLDEDIAFVLEHVKDWGA